ncbi:MAG: fasciclin domain-containing protein [Cyclobacteriaceae bacterium]|nr:fasciclin domain-containing protein [Cyclobacteriaceae bacterium HetDA_MAG_MS6]
MKLKLKLSQSNRFSNLLTLAFLAFSMLLISSCSDDDEDGMDNEIPESNIVELAEGTTDLNTLFTALSEFPDLVAALSDETASYTVFAPTNQAFATLLDVLGYDDLNDVPSDLLKEVLQYHVIGGSALRSTDLSDGQTANTLLDGETVTVSINGTNVMINMSNVITPNVEANNGIVHVIDAVLAPSFLVTEDIVQIASAALDLNILVSALSKFDDLVASLSDNTGTFTVFAPTDQAFASLLGVVGQVELDDIPEDVLKRILQYHVVSGTAAKSSDLTDGQSIPTLLADESVTVTISGSNVQIDDANVTSPNIEAVNGIIHVVDAVLVPSLEASIVNTVVEPAYFNKDFTILTEAVVTAGLLGTLIDSQSQLTVFAPTNDAFAAADIMSLDGLTADDLIPILQYHVLGSEVKKDDLPATGSAVSTLNGDFFLSINNDGVFINGLTEVVATDIDVDNGVVHVIDRTLLPASKNVVEIAVGLSEATEGAEFTQLVGALTYVSENGGTNLVSLLSSTDEDGTSAPFTIFAPTDSAFFRLYEAANVTDLNGLATALGVATVEAVLTYHVIGDARVFSADLPNLSSTTVNTLGGSITLDLSSLTITDTDAALEVGTSDATITSTDVLGTNGVIHVIDEVILP